MSSSKRLTEAFQRQFDWVSVLITDRQGKSQKERHQAMIFCAMHVCFALVLVAHTITVIASWCLAFVLQCVAMAVSVLFLMYVRQYKEKQQNAMELERMGNSLVVAQVAIRVFALLHALLMGSKSMLLLGLLEVGYDVFVARDHSLLLDATTVWREVEWRDRDAVIRFVYQVAVLVASIAHFLLSMILAEG